MKQWAKQKGFTIVELLIVIVVIAILAAITIVAYNGIQNRAKASALASTLQQTVTWLSVKKADSGGVAYPASIDDLNKNADYDYEYILEDGVYCVAIGNEKATSHTVSTDKSKKSPGPCPAGHWLLAGDGGDKGYYNKPGTVTGDPVLVANQRGEANAAYEFGAGKYISMTDSFWSTQFAIGSGGFTLSAWVNVSSHPGQRMTIIGQDYSSSMYFGIVSSGRLSFRLDDSVETLSNTALPLNQWVHVAVVYDRDAGGVATYYLNGAPDGSFTLSDLAIDANGRLNIGRQTRVGSGADSPFTGSISDVSWYKKSLSASEISQLFTATQ